MLLTHDTAQWLHVDIQISLACTIDSVQRPRQSTNDGNHPNNSEISPEILDKLRSFWLQLNFEELDSAIFFNPTRQYYLGS